MASKRKNLFLITVLLISAVVAFSAWRLLFPAIKSHPLTTKVATRLTNDKKLAAFSLADTNGNQFTQHSLQGQWTLLFFGYTKCPDICPSTLRVVSDSWSMFAAANKKAPVRFVFADVSNQQVSSQELQQFLQNYNPEFIGINGPSEQMHELSDQLGIYAELQGNLIDHTSSLMLINPRGQLCAIISPPFSAQDIVHDLTVLAL